MSASQATRAGRPVGQRDTQERCLVIAEHLFADYGFSGASLRDICGAAGISIPTLVHHFGSKKKLYGSVLDRIAGSMKLYMPDPDTTTVDADAILDMADRHLDWTIAYPHYSRLIMREVMENPGRVLEARQWHMRPIIAAYAALIRKGQEAGVLGQFDAVMFAFSFTGEIAHFYAAVTTVQGILSIEDRAEVIARYRRALHENTLAMLRGYAPDQSKMVSPIRKKKGA